MKEWLIAGWLHLIVGFLLGWIVVKRPLWATNLIAKIRTRVFG